MGMIADMLAQAIEEAMLEPLDMSNYLFMPVETRTRNVILRYRCIRCQGELHRTNPLDPVYGAAEYPWGTPHAVFFPVKHECLMCGAEYETDSKGEIVEMKWVSKWDSNRHKTPGQRAISAMFRPRIRYSEKAIDQMVEMEHWKRVVREISAPDQIG